MRWSGGCIRTVASFIAAVYPYRMLDPDKLALHADREHGAIRLLKQTEADLVVLKPAGMATELTSDPKGVSLVSRIRGALPEKARRDVRLVHRLDRPTRGVMLIALSRAAAAFYGEQIREGLWEKYYLARIAMPQRGVIRSLLGEHKAFIKEEEMRARLVRAGGKPSFLHIRAIEPAPERPGEAHVLIKLITGRLHQIRVMLAGLGYPLIGDDFYGEAVRGEVGESEGPPKRGARTSRAAGAAPATRGDFYLEHIALWYVDFTTRDIVLAHDRDDPGRERVSPAMQKAIDSVLRPPM